MFKLGSGKPYWGLTGTWLTVWVTVACATDMVGSYHTITWDSFDVHTDALWL
jgi:hypothetical protein